MKVIVSLLFVLCVVEGFLPPPNAESCTNPAEFTSFFCGFIPEGCLSPVCGADALGNAVWFKSRCHIFVFNLRCNQRYRPAPDICLPELRPPVSTRPCPVPFLPGK